MRCIMRDKEYRIHQSNKHKARAKQIICDSWKIEPTEKNVGMTAKTPHRCSAWCCGNPRKWFKEKTIQERRIEDYSLE